LREFCGLGRNGPNLYGSILIGPLTVEALQDHVGAVVDGDWGTDTTRHLQVTLNAERF
jgi:hypothetical protein